MAKEKNIKKSNRKILAGYLVVNFLLFSFISKWIEFSDLNSFIEKLFDPKHIFVVILYGISIVLEGLISSNAKAKIIFWRIKNPLPGTRAFSDIIKKDQRADVSSLKKLFPDGFPKDPSSQNAEWYKLYRKYSSTGTVFEAHRAFLLTRDLAAMTLILIPFSIIGHILLSVAKMKILLHALILSALFIINNVSSQNYGNRFVANVLVEAAIDK